MLDRENGTTNLVHGISGKIEYYRLKDGNA